MFKLFFRDIVTCTVVLLMCCVLMYNLALVLRMDARISRARMSILKEDFDVTTNKNRWNSSDVYENRELLYNNDTYVNWTIIVEFNNGAFQLFRNWYSYFLKLNLSTHAQLVVIAEDDKVFRRLRPMRKDVVRVVRSEYTNISHGAVYNTPAFNALMSARASHILSHMENTRFLLFSDVDTVWLSNPLPYFTGDFDLWAPREKEQYSAGFFAIRCNLATKTLMQKWQRKLKEKVSLNQRVFNDEILDSPNIRHTGLNEFLFTSGKKYFDQKFEKNRSQAVVVHNNFITGISLKIGRFKKFNLWNI